MSQFQSNAAARSWIVGATCDPPVAVVCHRRLGPADLYYTRVRGRFIRESDSPGVDVAVGVVLSGSVRLDRFGRTESFAEGDVVMQLPGDEAVQYCEDFEGFTVRIPISVPQLTTLLAMPYATRRNVPRVAERCDAQEVLAVVTFAAQESERASLERLQEPATQFTLLGRALTERAVALLGTSLPESTGHEPECLAVCEAALRRLQAANGERTTVSEMAVAAACSVRTLYRAFDDLASIGPSEFELRFRLNLARLAVTRAAREDRREEAIWCRFAFPSANSFRHAYRLEFGETPVATMRRRHEAWEDLVDELEWQPASLDAGAMATVR